MSTIYSGIASNVTTPLTRTITGCVSAGGLIKVTTSVNHLFSTGNFVSITGVVGTTEANGQWTITVVDSTHFTLDSSTFIHTYSSGGTVVDHSLTPAFTQPSNGEASTVDSILVSIQTLADRTQKLALPFETGYLRAVATPDAFTPNVPAGFDFTAGYFLQTLSVGAAGNFAIRAPHRGAKLGAVTIRFTTSTDWTVVPSSFPALEVFRQSVSTPATIDDLYAAGQIVYPTESLSTWNDGNTKSLTLLSDQANIIDSDNYYYYGRLTDANGGTATTKRLRYYSLVLAYDLINTNTFP